MLKLLDNGMGKGRDVPGLGADLVSKRATLSTRGQEDNGHASSVALLPMIKRYLQNTWLHPRHLAQREIDDFVRAEGPSLRGVMLDVGCGKKPYLRHASNVKKYIAVDVPSTIHGVHHADVMASVLALPFESETFDSVLCVEVLEHTADPSLGLREMARVAKPGATLLLTVPLSEMLHEEPNDY